MTTLSSGLPPVWENIGFVIGFLLSLAMFSYIVRDNWLVRLAQYLLIGVGLGYTAVITWQSVLLPRLVRPLLEPSNGFVQAMPGSTSTPLFLIWIPLFLGLLLWIAGIDYLRGGDSEKGRVRQWLHGLAVLPLAIIAGVGLGVGIAGTLQGTFVPQFLRAADFGLQLDAAPGVLMLGILTLLITSSTLLYIQVDASEIQDRSLPLYLRVLVRGWGWIGQRALWLTAGFLFAQIFSARMTLLIARLEYFLFDVRSSNVWHWLQAMLAGGGQ